MGKSKKKSKSNQLPQKSSIAGPALPSPAAAPASATSSTNEATEPQIPQPMSLPHTPSPEAPQHQDFPSFYLSSVTAAFADDIEKLRLASDFRDSSVPILIQALKEGAEIYGEEERGSWMGR
ncbi:hypothetical protein MMC30_007494 [Trapelia coarctata]|nr:hypothetical protein [Trapelia coarctata]